MAKQIITDEELKLKRQARRRLLGAIALTILVVILLPMVLDSEPPAPLQDIDLKIPDKDKVGEFVPKMVLPPLSTTDAASQPESAPVMAPVIAPLLDVKPSAEVVNPQAPAKVVAEVHSSVKPEVKPQVAETKVKPESKPVAKSAAKTHTGFVIQVGAFANAEAAKKLQEKLMKQGYPSYTEKAGNKVRVRIGDYASHAEADKIRRKLEIQGMKPNVINLK